MEEILFTQTVYAKELLALVNSPSFSIRSAIYTFLGNDPSRIHSEPIGVAFVCLDKDKVLSIKIQLNSALPTQYYDVTAEDLFPLANIKGMLGKVVYLLIQEWLEGVVTRLHSVRIGSLDIDGKYIRITFRHSQSVKVLHKVMGQMAMELLCD